MIKLRDILAEFDYGRASGPEGTQRGKLYLAYIQKQLPRFDGQWNIRTGTDSFIVDRIDNP